MDSQVKKRTLKRKSEHVQDIAEENAKRRKPNIQRLFKKAVSIKELVQTRYTRLHKLVLKSKLKKKQLGSVSFKGFKLEPHLKTNIELDPTTALHLARTCENPIELKTAFFEPSHKGIYIFKGQNNFADKSSVTHIDSFKWTSNSEYTRITEKKEDEVIQTNLYATNAAGKVTKDWSKKVFYNNNTYVVQFLGKPKGKKRFREELCYGDSASESEDEDCADKILSLISDRFNIEQQVEGKSEIETPQDESKSEIKTTETPEDESKSEIETPEDESKSEIETTEVQSCLVQLQKQLQAEKDRSNFLEHCNSEMSCTFGKSLNDMKSKIEEKEIKQQGTSFHYQYFNIRIYIKV